jgi:hypothetical protein
MHIGNVAGFLASVCACIRHLGGGGGADKGLDTGNWLGAGLTTCKASGEYVVNS